MIHKHHYVNTNQWEEGFKKNKLRHFKFNRLEHIRTFCAFNIWVLKFAKEKDWTR